MFIFDFQTMTWQHNECVYNEDHPIPKIDAPTPYTITKKSTCVFAKAIYAIQLPISLHRISFN